MYKVLHQYPVACNRISLRKDEIDPYGITALVIKAVLIAIAGPTTNKNLLGSIWKKFFL